jgi:hypothetical protein
MCTFFYQKYHEYCVAGGIWELTEEEKKNPDLMYHTNTHNLMLGGIHVKQILVFLSMKKTKPLDKTSLLSHVLKYHDAIL